MKHLRRAVALAGEVEAADPSNARGRRALNYILAGAAGVVVESDPAEAARLYRRALVLLDELPTSGQQAIDLRRDRGYQLAGLAHALQKLGDRAASAQHLRQALEIRQAISVQDPVRVQLAREVGITQLQMGDLLQENGDRVGAVASYQQALGMAEKLVAEHPTEMTFRSDLANSYERLGRYYCVGDRARGMEWHQKAVGVWREWSRWGVSSVYDTRRRARAEQALARCEAQRPAVPSKP
jgi:tetratricopeptide (TPR) repeat protein